MFKVEKGIPIPAPLKRRPLFPVADMEVGDSFTVPYEFAKDLRAAAHTYGWRNRRKYSVRKQPDGLVRCWRVA